MWKDVESCRHPGGIKAKGLSRSRSKSRSRTFFDWSTQVHTAPCPIPHRAEGVQVKDLLRPRDGGQGPPRAPGCVLNVPHRDPAGRGSVKGARPRLRRRRRRSGVDLPGEETDGSGLRRTSRGTEPGTVAAAPSGSRLTPWTWIGRTSGYSMRNVQPDYPTSRNSCCFDLAEWQSERSSRRPVERF